MLLKLSALVFLVSGFLVAVEVAAQSADLDGVALAATQIKAGNLKAAGSAGSAGGRSASDGPNRRGLAFGE